MPTFIHLTCCHVISCQLSTLFASTTTIKSGGPRSSRLAGMFVLRAAFLPLNHFMGLLRSMSQCYFSHHASIVDLYPIDFIQQSRSFDLLGMAFLLPVYLMCIFIFQATLLPLISDEEDLIKWLRFS